VPRKVFVAGEILTAAAVNENLMDQAVMSFAGTAARGSAIPSPVEGMAAYLEDQNVLSLYDGSAWKGSLAVTGGILDVKSATKTNTQTGSVAAGATLAITDLNISHAVKDAGNRVLLYALVNGSSGTNEYFFNAAITAGGSLLNIGDAASNRTRVGASNGNRGTAATAYVQSVSLIASYSPGTTSSVTYGVSLINADTGTRTLYLNRSEGDGNDAFNVRAASALILQEVAA
jgi:hypothetical protein